MASILHDYRRHAAEHHAYMVNGDADASNASYDRLNDAFMSLALARQRDTLFTLYGDPDPAVQSWAAAHTLEVDEARALAKLEEIQRARIPHLSLDAEYTIREWKNGNLAFLPVDRTA